MNWRGWSPLAYLIGYKLTPTGRALVLVMLTSAVGCVTAELPIYQVFAFLSAILFCIEATGILFQPRLQAEVWLPTSVGAGEPIRGYAVLKNCGRWPAFDVMCSLFGLGTGLKQLEGEVMLPVIPAGESGRLPLVISTTRRGLQVLPPLRPHSTFPFNVLRYGRQTVPLPSVLVLPQFQPLEEFRLPPGQRYQTGGVLVEGRIGSSPEYVGNREYQPGESIRRLDFRAWARVGKPVVREYQEELCSRVALILDTSWSGSWWQRRGDHQAFEAAISLTAAMADSLRSTEAIVDFFAAGPELHVFRTAAQSAQFEQIQEILAGVEQTSRNPFEELSPAVSEELESLSTVICLFLNWDKTRAEFVQHVLNAGCEVRVYLIRDERIPAEPFAEDGETYIRLSPQAIQAGEITRL